MSSEQRCCSPSAGRLASPDEGQAVDWAALGREEDGSAFAARGTAADVRGRSGAGKAVRDSAAVASPGVLIYAPQLLPAGQHYIREHALRLRRYRPVLAGRRQVAGIPLENFPHFLFPETVPGRMRETGYLLAGYDGGLASFIRQHRIRLIHAHFGPGGTEILGIAVRMKIPLVVTFHGWDVKAGSQTGVRMSAYERLYRRRLPKLYHAASQIICVSRSLENRAVAMGCPADKVCTKYLGVDSAFFDGDRGPVDPASILFVGRLVKLKGVHTLIEAMSLLRSRNRSVHLTVVGEGPEGEKLKRMAEERRVEVRFVGRRSPGEIRELLRSAAVLCAPSTTAEGELPEALGLVLLEAQAMGVPVVATRNGGIPEAMEEGRTGLLAEVNSPAGVAEALEKLLSDPSLNREFGERARAFVSGRFDIVRCYQDLESLYDRILFSRDEN